MDFLRRELKVIFGVMRNENDVCNTNVRSRKDSIKRIFANKSCIPAIPFGTMKFENSISIFTALKTMPSVNGWTAIYFNAL